MEHDHLISHVSLGTNDFARSLAFYDAVLEVLGCRRLFDFPGAVAYGKKFPEFWVQKPIDEEPATQGNGTHFGFVASSREEVDAFFRAALLAGAQGDGEPGERPHYGKEYYGCFVRDPDGHKVEATYWDATKSAPAS